MDSLGECLRFLKAKRKEKLVSPTEHVVTDEHEDENEQLKPLGEGREDGEMEDEDNRGLGQDMAAEDQEQEDVATGSGGASGAPAPGGRRRSDQGGGAEEEGEEGREARKAPTPIGPSREERERKA